MLLIHESFVSSLQPNVHCALLSQTSAGLAQQVRHSRTFLEEQHAT